MSEHTADYSKHTEEELRDGIAKIDELQAGSDDDSGDKLEAAREQREHMASELQQRGR